MKKEKEYIKFYNEFLKFKELGGNYFLVDSVNEKTGHCRQYSLTLEDPFENGKLKIMINNKDDNNAELFKNCEYSFIKLCKKYHISTGIDLTEYISDEDKDRILRDAIPIIREKEIFQKQYKEFLAKLS